MSYAIFRSGGKQFKAEKGSTLRLPSLPGDAGAKVEFNEVLLASDGSAVPATGRTGHPRSFGTFPKVIRRHVREQKLLSLEEAVRKMTSLPAQALRQKDRGTLAEGLLANVVVFDAERFTDRATWLDPQRYAEGVQYLLVNGALVVDGGAQTDARAGRVIGA